MGYRVLQAADAYWRPSNQMAVLSAVAVEPSSVRQAFNDTEADQLWLVVGAPPEPAPAADDLARLYPDGPKALPPKLA